MSSNLSAITQVETDWIDRHLALARKFVVEHSSGDEGAPLTLESLDRAWSRWLEFADSYSDREVDRGINCVGAAFGNSLVESGEFEWVINTDEYGTSLAVVACRYRGDVTVHPTDFVGKRWDSREDDFLVHGHKFILERVQETKAEWGAAKKLTGDQAGRGDGYKPSN